MKRGHSPDDIGTRAQFYMELLTHWETTLRIAKRKKLAQIERNVRIAIEVLKSSYAVSELYDLTKIEKATEDAHK